MSGSPAWRWTEIYRLPDGRLCLIADRFAADEGYLPLVTGDLSTGALRPLRPEEYDLGQAKKRHGGILEITGAEARALMDNSWK